MAQYEVNYLYEDLPVKINSEDLINSLENFTVEKLESHEPLEVVNFLNAVHRIIYDFLIYTVGDKDIQNGLITQYIEQLEKPLKRALLAQAEYMVENGNIEMDNGKIALVNGITPYTTQEVLTKIICPSVINILMATKPCLLWVGE